MNIPSRAPTFDTLVERPDGSRRSVQTMVFPIQTPVGHRLGSISRDLTAQKQSEALLHLQSEALESAVTAS